MHQYFNLIYAGWYYKLDVDVMPHTHTYKYLRIHLQKPRWVGKQRKTTLISQNKRDKVKEDKNKKTWKENDAKWKLCIHDVAKGEVLILIWNTCFVVKSLVSSFYKLLRVNGILMKGFKTISLYHTYEKKWDLDFQIYIVEGNVQN